MELRFKEYTKIKAIGHEENKKIFENPNDEIVIQEKMDGANFRFMIKDGKLVVGSRTQELHEDIEHKYAKNFERCIREVLKAYEGLNEDTLKASEGKVFYAECMVRHTMGYDWENIPPLLGFDIYALQSDNYLHYKNVKNLFAAWNLSIVPLIGIKKAGEIKEINDDIVPISKYPNPSSKDQKAEGIVFKNYDKQIFAKYVRNEFKEKNSEAFGGNPKYNKVDDTDNASIAFAYCTNARIDKCIFKLIDLGEKLDMTLMQKLPKMVYEDIMEEEWREIVSLKKRYKVDFYKLNKLFTRRCLSVLQQVITNNALGRSKE